MELASILGPWILLLLLALPLIYVEKLLHQHMYGVGYLLTKDQESATRFYYLLFFPGIFLHEFIQYLTAGLLNIKVKSIKMRPQKQNNGTLRFDFVTIDRRHTETWQAAVMGGIPFIIACVLVWTISNTILELTEVPAAFSTGDIRNIGEAFGQLRDTPDFWLWMYLLFAISNGMLPTKEDREGWYLILVGLGGLSVLFFIIGLQSVIVETLTGPVTESLNLVNTALFIILSIDIGVVLMLGLVEDTIERITGEKMDYSGSGSKSSSDGKRQPGSNVPIPKGELLPSVYNITLPLPVLPKRGQMPIPRPTVTAPAEEEAKPAAPRRETPAFARTDTQEVERVPDPDAAARAQMDPRVPRTSGDSPFRRTTLTAEEEEKQDEKPAAERKEATTSQRFGRRQPEEKEAKPASSRFGRREREEEKDEAKASPFARRTPDTKEEAKPGRFSRGREEAAEEKEAKPASSRFSRRGREEEKDEAKPSPFARRTPDTKEEAKPGRFSRGREEAAEEKEAKPASSRFGRREREEEKDEAKASPFARRTPDTKEEAKPASSRFDRRQREEEKPEAKASPFARRTPDTSEKEETKADTGRTGRRRNRLEAQVSPFARRSSDSEEDEKPKPASSRFERDETAEDEDDEPQVPSRFGRRVQQAFSEETQQFEPTQRMKAADLTDDEDEAPAKPARPTGQFKRNERPSRTEGRQRDTDTLPEPSLIFDDEPPDDESGGDDDVEYVDFDDT